MESEWGNGERDRGNGERMRKCRESISLHFLFISSFSLHLLFISSFSLRFLAAWLQGCSGLWHPGVGIGIVPQPANENDKSNLSSGDPLPPSFLPSFIFISQMTFLPRNFIKIKYISIFRQMFPNISENFSMQNSGGKLIRDSQCETPLNSTLGT